MEEQQRQHLEASDKVVAHPTGIQGVARPSTGLPLRVAAMVPGTWASITAVCATSVSLIVLVSVVASGTENFGLWPLQNVEAEIEQEKKRRKSPYGTSTLC